MKALKSNKRLSLFVIVCLLVTAVIGGIAIAEDDQGSLSIQPTDISGHWAEDTIEKWIKKGAVKGYDDGSFKPEKTITRAEFMTIVNRAFGYSDKADVSFSDVSEDSWYIDEIAKAKAVGYISGYQDGTMKPDNEITREEAAAIISRIMALEPEADSDTLNRFTDSELFPAWSKGYIAAAVENNYLNGYPDNTYKPAKPITRSESIVVMDRVAGDTYNLAGTYGPDEGMQTIEGNVTISSTEVRLQNTQIKGNLYITEGVGDGNVELDKVTVEGKTLIKGGGPNSIVVTNSELGLTIVDTKTGNVRVVSRGTTRVERVVLNSGANLQEEELTGTGFENCALSLDIPEGEEVIFAGDFGQIDVAGEGVNVSVLSGTIGQLNLNSSANVNVTGGTITQIDVEETAEGSEIVVAGNASVTTINMNASVAVRGEGAIQTANINSEGCSFENEPVKLAFGEGVTSVRVGDEEVTAPSEVPSIFGNTGGGSSGGGSNDIDVTAVSIDGAAVVGETLTAAPSPSGAAVNYQWQRADTADGTYVDISGATSSTYQIAADDVGKHIRVRVTGTDNYSGTVTSDPVGPVPPVETVSTVERDPGNTGGLSAVFYAETNTFSGTIDYYEEASGFPPAAGNYVGVKITAPEDVVVDSQNATFSYTSYAGEYKTLTGSEWLDGDNYVYYYPLVTDVPDEFTVVIDWDGEGTVYAEETIVIRVADGAILEAPPELTSVTPVEGSVVLEYDETFVLTVDGYDAIGLYELEIDHSMESELQEFSVYASEENPYGTNEDKAAFESYGVDVTYDGAEQKWTIDFGPAVTNTFVEKGGITFYIVIKDTAGNEFGTMYGTTPENTFAYIVTQAAPVASTYKFNYAVPEDVIEGESYTVPVTIEPTTVGDVGYESVRFNVDVLTPNGATLQLLATDTSGEEHDVATIGYWGLPTGFPIEANYSATTNFTAIFSDAGEYTITFALVDLNADKEIVSDTVTVTVSAPEPEVTFTFNGLDDVTAGTVDFSIATKVTDNGAIADGTPLRYKAVVTKGGEPLANQTIKYGEGFVLTFTTDENGIAYFGPSNGFTLAQLPKLKEEGVTTPFQAGLAVGSYSVTVSLVDISEGEEVELGSGTKEFTVLAATLTAEEPSYKVAGTDGCTRFAGSVDVAESIQSGEIQAYYIFEVTEGSLAADTALQYWNGTEWQDFVVEEGKYRFGSSSGFDLSTVDGHQTEFQAMIEGYSITGKAYLVDAETQEVISNIEETTVIAEPTLSE